VCQEPAQVFVIAAWQNADPAADVLGLWRPPAQDANAPREASFGMASQPEMPLRWQVNLPGALDVAKAALAKGEVTVQVSHRGLERAADRLELFAGAAPLAGDAERDLSAALTEIRFRSSELSYGLAPQIGGRLAAAVEGFEAFMRQSQQVLADFARVETMSSGRPLATTIVSWSGRMTTTWRAMPTIEHVTLHQRSLGVALETRATVLRYAVLVVQGAQLLLQAPIMLATPPTAVLYMTSAWRFISQVISERNGT
jgi:hypothetical protein